MICPSCGYDMGDFDTECKKCKNLEKFPSSTNQRTSKNRRNSRKYQLSDDVDWLRILKVMSFLICAIICFYTISYAGNKCYENIVMNSLKLSQPEENAALYIHDLQTVVETGINFTKYGDYLIEAKNKINKEKKEDARIKKKSQEVKNCHEIFWNYIDGALDDFQAAKTEWNDQIKSEYKVNDSKIQSEWASAEREIYQLDNFVEMRERKSVLYKPLDQVRNEIKRILDSQREGKIRDLQIKNAYIEMELNRIQ